MAKEQQLSRAERRLKRVSSLGEIPDVFPGNKVMNLPVSVTALAEISVVIFNGAQTSDTRVGHCRKFPRSASINIEQMASGNVLCRCMHDVDHGMA